MKCDIVLAGVGGQGVLSVAAIISASALRAGLHAVQSEVHGMSQRGGAVTAHLRLSDEPIHSSTIGHGCAEILLSMEPLESLRYLDMLKPSATLLTSTEPVENFGAYPDLEGVLAKIREFPGARLVDATRLAREAGNVKTANMVMVGAAIDLLPIAPEVIEDFVRESFASKGDKVVDANLKAFAAGRALAAEKREAVGV
jgi:indolepyruvate ferredoxin oxidoreductase, beta subunit